MERRTIWIIVGSVLGAFLVVCMIIGGIGLYTYRQIQRQNQQVTDIFATIEAGLQTETPLDPDPTSTPNQPAPAAPTVAPESTATVETPESAASSSPDTRVAADDIAASLIADSRDELAKQPNATLYQIEAALDPNQYTIAGTQTVRYTNTEDTALDELYFRLYVNAPHYNEGGITVDDVQVDGAAVQPTLEQDDTTLKLELAQPLQPGQTVDVAMRFTTTVPTSGGGYGIFNEANGVWTLYNWHPEVAVYEKGGWLLNPVSDQGDPTNTDAANYQVTFAAPQAYTVITSGLETGAQPLTSSEVPNTQTTHTSVAALARNFVVVASDQFERSTRQIGGTSVSSYYLRDSKTGGEVALDTTIKSLEIFGTAFGSYPYAEMDIAQVDLQGAAGMESTGLIMIGSDLYGAGGNPLGGAGGALPGAEGANALVFTTAHEAAHQWWYSVVGSDAYTQPWLDESLTNWSSAYYVDQAAGKEAGALARDMFIGFSYRSTLANGDQRLDQPVDQFEEQAYGGIVYGKGALMYDVLRQELGDEKFFEFLQRYYREQQFDRADSDEWLQTLNTVAGKDMTPFYQKWVEGTSIQADDLPQGGALSNILGGFENALPGASTAP